MSQPRCHAPASPFDLGVVQCPECGGDLHRRLSSPPCPGCGGPITFTADDSDGITVYFHCPNAECGWGKHS